MGFRIAGDRQAIQSGFQSDRVWANDQLCGAPPPQMQEMNSAIRGANPVCSRVGLLPLGNDYGVPRAAAHPDTLYLKLNIR